MSNKRTSKSNTDKTAKIKKETAREYAKDNINQLKNAQETYLEAMSKAQSTFLQTSGLNSTQEMNELNHKTLDFMKANLVSGLTLAEKLVDATDISEAVEIQNDFVRDQLENYAEQAQELSDLLTNNSKKG